jgi:hypothetical protein
MKNYLKFGLCVSITGLILVGCSTAPTVNNYSTYMNQPTVKNGDSGTIENKQLNKPAWNELEVAGMHSYRQMPDGSYAYNPHDGLLYVRASVVNSGTTPVQAKWRCKFYDSNNIPLYDEQNDERATSAMGLGWHTMIAYPLKSKSQTDDANLIRCVAPEARATEYRIEAHDTANDITIYKHE